MDPFYIAVSLFRRRKYQQCIDQCNELLLKNPANQGPWELKMRAMTQRVYVDDIDIDDGMPDEFLENQTGILRSKTSLKTAKAIETSQKFSDGRPRTSTGRPMTGIVSFLTVHRPIIFLMCSF
jgi:tetratricopeptide repeat protein 8